MSERLPRPNSGTARRFPCTVAGGVARGQRRLRLLLLGPAVLMAGAAIWTFLGGRPVAGLLCIAVGLVAFVAWRMSGERGPLWIRLAPGELTVRTRTSEATLPIVDATARRLADSELTHLRRLASVAGVVVPSGGFDSRLLGEFELYASALRNAVLVEAGDERWVVTPDDPEGFLSEFRRLAADRTTVPPAGDG